MCPTGRVSTKYRNGLAIIMNQFPPASENFFLSPLLREQRDSSPYLSPFANPYRQEPADFDDLIHFQLEDPPLSHRPLPERPEEEPAAKREEFTEREAAEESSQAVEPANTPEAATWHAEVKEEEASLPFFAEVTPHGDSEIPTMIQFLVEHSQLKEEALQLEGRRLSSGNLGLLRVFRLLAGKFKRLRKTKEEMTKYCLRKAFKFIAAGRNSQARDLDHCMRQYFEDAGGSFSIPFKKHSSEKTMNANFLQRIFTCEQFARDYRAFLAHFRPMVAEDNSKKVRYLAELVEEALEKGEVDAVVKIKRLPWTRAILEQVLELAVAMPDGSQLPSARQSRKRSE